MAVGETDNTPQTYGEDQGAAAAPTDQSSGVRREVGDLPEARLSLCKTITKDVKEARKFWEDDFKRMRADQDFLLGLQYDGQAKLEDDRYIANIVQRHVQQRTAAIYAKNPTVVARRKQKMDFKLWDENPLTAQMAMQAVSQMGQIAQAAQNGDPNAQAQIVQGANSQAVIEELATAKALLADIQQGMLARATAGRVSQTMELYFKNKVLTQQYPPFKASMKQLVRRTMAAGVGYLKLGFVREMEMSPDVMRGIATLQENIATIERMMADMTDGDPAADEMSGEREDLRLAMASLQSQEMVVTQEGVLFDFPSSTSIIPDKKMIQLQGFVGCDWVAEEFMFTPDQVQEIWKVDICTGYTVYNPDGAENPAPVSSSGTSTEDEGKKGMACIWIVYNRKTGLTYTVCDGYTDFLEDPCAPKLKLERFYPWFPLTFNLIEHFKQKFPLSDVFLLRHPQREYNRSRQGLREQRIANRPATAVPKGVLDPDDIKKLEDRPANAVIQFNALAPGQKIGDVLQTIQHPEIDEKVYETDTVFQDVLRVVGSQEANLGGTSNATATESSIAESSRMSSLQSNMDDMDDFLTEVMRAAGQAVLMEVGRDEIVKVVGEGAVWPKLSGQDVADEIFLEIQAGSSGRPNKAVEIQNFTQMLPLLLQIPGINPQWLGKQALIRMDDRLDLTDAFLAGSPSIQTLNAMAAKPLGQDQVAPGGQDPRAQGGKGGQNAEPPAGAGGALGPQPANAAPPAVAAPVR